LMRWLQRCNYPLALRNPPVPLQRQGRLQTLFFSF